LVSCSGRPQRIQKSIYCGDLVRGNLDFKVIAGIARRKLIPDMVFMQVGAQSVPVGCEQGFIVVIAHGKVSQKEMVNTVLDFQKAQKEAEAKPAAKKTTKAVSKKKAVKKVAEEAPAK
jgi:F420-0:gamma-glutamyl ligase